MLLSTTVEAWTSPTANHRDRWSRTACPWLVTWQQHRRPSKESGALMILHTLVFSFCWVKECGPRAQTPLRLSLQMQYDRVFPVATPGELQITSFCAPQQTDAEISDAAHNERLFVRSSRGRGLSLMTALWPGAGSAGGPSRCRALSARWQACQGRRRIRGLPDSPADHLPGGARRDRAGSPADRHRQLHAPAWLHHPARRLGNPGHAHPRPAPPQLTPQAHPDPAPHHHCLNCRRAGGAPIIAGIGT
jgi:hypothetical protein